MSGEKMLDRINQAYRGELGERMQQKSEERIGWMCSNVSGARVLDVGCSQGIVSILLGRSGYSVLGLDIEPEQIEYANRELEKESEAVRSRVSFQCGDFLAVPVEPGSVDCVVMGECLEHVTEPERFLDKAAEILSPAGRLIVTVPFGISPFPDHKRTYYFSELYEQICARIPVTEFRFFGLWVGFVADVAGDRSACFRDLSLIRSLEESFFAVDRQKQDAIDRLSSQKETIQKDREISHRKLAEQGERILALQDEIRSGNAQSALLREQIGDRDAEITRLHGCIDETEQKLSDSEETVSEQTEQIALIENEREQLKQMLRANRRQISAFEQEVVELKGYRREYERVLASPSVQRLFAFKKFLRKPYRPLYLQNRASSEKNEMQKAPPIRSDLPTVTVVIPTYRPNDTLVRAVDSVLTQQYDDPAKLKVLLCVNGSDRQYAESLGQTYADCAAVNVRYTEKKGAAAGRNLARDALETEYVAYLDDDDYLTPGYLQSLACHATEGVTVICGRMVDENGTVTVEDTYINRALNNAGTGLSGDYLSLASLFSSFPGKLFRRDLMTEILGPMDETVAHTEDTCFWVDNIDRMTGLVYTCEAFGSEAYVRRVTENSLSRPGDESGYAFFITDRLSLIERFSRRVFELSAFADKRFVLIKIDAAVQMMRNYYDGLYGELRTRARNEIFACSSPFLNKTRFSETKGIAFCHNFAPAADASAYVASKRLPQVAAAFGGPVAWKVVCADMSKQRSRDLDWEMLYARYQYESRLMTDTPVYFNEKAQVAWGKAVFEQVRDEPAEVIYSRSMWIGSHVAASLYKRAHPDVIWYAEFSDPVYMDTGDTVRAPSSEYTGEDAFLRTFWKDIEQTVFREADHILFTNASQLSYMLEKNPPEDPDAVRSKCEVWLHPRLDPMYRDLEKSPLELEADKIHVGYFGTFYANRNIAPLLPLLESPNVIFHVFSKITGELEELAGKYAGMRLHPMAPHLQFLNLAGQMDYCVLNDIDFPGEVNPYIPSKLADYLSAGSRVIAVTIPGTELDRLEHPDVLKVRKIDHAFVETLTSRRQHQQTF